MRFIEAAPLSSWAITQPNAANGQKLAISNQLKLASMISDHNSVMN